MTIGIKIMPREVILDTQGRAIESWVKSNGFKVNSVRAGKFLEIQVPTEDITTAKKKIEEMLSEGGLYNPLIEKYEIFMS